MSLLSKTLRNVATIVPFLLFATPLANAEHTNDLECINPPGRANPADPFGCAASKITRDEISHCNLETLGQLANQGLHTLSYEGARERMFQFVDVFVSEDNVRSVKSVYSPDLYAVGDAGIPQNGVNCEHSWPQSFLKLGERFKESRTDLFHLFPVNGRVNSSRNNLPFADCAAHSQEQGVRCHDGFEPPERHKGRVARAMFYIAATYKLEMGNSQEVLLRQWNTTHPVTTDEVERSMRVHAVQGNWNPFISHPEWVELVSDF